MFPQCFRAVIMTTLKFYHTSSLIKTNRNNHRNVFSGERSEGVNLEGARWLGRESVCVLQSDAAMENVNTNLLVQATPTKILLQAISASVPLPFLRSVHDRPCLRAQGAGHVFSQSVEGFFTLHTFLFPC